MKTKLLALTLALLLLAGLLAGCGASSDSAAADTTSDAAGATAPEESYDSSDESAADSGGDALYDEAMPEEPKGQLTTVTTETESGEKSQTVSDLTEKLIYTANLEIETTEFDEAVKAVDQLVAKYNGFIENSDVSGRTSWQEDGSTKIVDRYAYYTLRIPAGSFQEALRQAGSIGNVISSVSGVQNVTSQFIDQEARQNSLEVQEQRLLAMLEKSEDVETLVQLEARLSEVRYEIESIERNLRNLQTQVDYSTITLSLTEVAVYTPTASVQRTFGQRLSDAFSDGWNDFGRSLQNFAVWFLRSLPTLILLAVLAVVVIVVVRKIFRRRRISQLPPSDQGQNDTTLK